MNERIYDVLEPYEDEALYSWVIRMIRLYNNDRLYNSSKVIHLLFGPEANEIPSLYFQEGLDYFAAKCDLPHSPYFKSEETIIEKMSILPFYYKFMSSSNIEYLKHIKNKNKGSFRYTPNDFGISFCNRPIEGEYHIKFCESCIKEAKEIHLKREHLIPGNLFCYKHKILLKKAPFNRRHLKIDFIKILEDENNISGYELNEKQIETAQFISEAIHVILKDKDESTYVNARMVIKEKIKDFLDSKNDFKDLEDICDAMNEISIIKSKILPIQLRDYLVTSRKLSPIFTLHLVYLLFGSLDEYEAYKKYKNL